MTCDQTRAAFSDLYDEALSGARLVTITQHLASCPECRAEWAKFRKVVQAMADLGTADPSPGFAARVRQRLETPPPWQRALQWLFYPLHVKVPIQAMAVVLVAFAGLLIYQRSPELRRTIEPSRIPSPPGPGEASRFSAPPAVGDLPRKGEGPAPRVEASKEGRAESQAPPTAALATRLLAPREAEKDRGAAPPRDDAKGVVKAAMPPESPKAEESSREFRAKTAEPGIPAQMSRQAPPAPAQPGGATAPLSSPRSLAAPPSAPTGAPARENQISSLQGMPADPLYVTGLTDLAEGKFELSIDEFRAFIAQYPQDARVPDARLRLGEAYFGQSRYTEALREYEAVVQQFPSSPQVPTALYLQAQARLAQGDRSGCRLLRELEDRYPQAPEATLARQALSARCP